MDRHEQLIYLASAIDHDGCISISTAKGVFHLMLRLSMCKRESVDLFAAMFNAKIGEWHSQKGRMQWQTWLCGSSAADALQELLPFMLVKRKEALLAIKFQALKEEIRCERPLSTISGGGWTEADMRKFSAFAAVLRRQHVRT